MRIGSIENNLNAISAKSSDAPLVECLSQDIRRKTRVLMVGMHTSKTRGGISTLISVIMDSELKNDVEFTFIASQAEDYGKIRKLLLALAATARFISQGLLHRPDLVYVHLGSNASLYREGFFVFLGKLMRLPVLAHFHAGDIKHYYPRQWKLGRWLIRRAIMLSDGLIAVSKDSASWLRALKLGLRVEVLQNAINVKEFAEPRDRFTSERGDDTARLLFVGAMGKLKGERDLLSALALLKDRGVPVKASLLGYGGEEIVKVAAELNLNEMIEHMGPVSMDDRIGFFKKADIFVLPTYAEAMPMSVIEAMASGLAVVATPVGGIPYLIEDGVDGLLFPCGDVNALAARLRTLIDDPELRNKIGSNAQKRAKAQFDVSGYSKRLGEIMDRAISSAR